MESIIQAIEIFALVTGIVYVVLEILQKNAMWVIGILTGAACAFEFAVTHVWASMGLNLYYVAMSVVGLIQWRKASGQVEEGDIHLQKVSLKAGILSAVLFTAGTAVMIPVLKATGDPAPFLDAIAVMLSVVGTWWLAQSYLEQWLIWIVADVLTTTLCLTTGQYWMAVLYLVYIGSAVYGYVHWKSRGKYVSLKDSSLRSE
ncbi:MAG: nicotinamide mononucleotide transporter [Bacteroidales bacterium]|nr:nicotinamide mononucleotide transporter [Bacteroidales bacterium]